MKRLCCSLVAFATCCLLSGSARAADIAWVSFHATNAGSAAAVAAGATEAPDLGYINLLTGAGHTITRIVVPAAANNVAIPPDTLTQLNGSDLVIVGRSVNSGSFQEAAETASWNNDITKPMIITSGFLTRANRLGYNTGDTTADITTAQSLVANSPAHPVFNGITLNGSNETGPILQMVSFNGTQQLGTSINTNPLVAGATLIASITGTGAPANGPVIAEFPAGTASANAGETFASKRMIFITGSRENGITGEMAGIMDLTGLGQQMFLNTVTYLTGPPPILGDTDGDGVVELADDFGPIRDNFRKSGKSRAQGDLTGGGVVDFADFRQWKAAFTGGGGSLAGVDLGFLANVPEPGTAILLLFGAFALWGRRTFRRG